MITWGNRASGGDSSAVQPALQDVRSIAATGGAFAALRGDGVVVTWGELRYGGDSSAVQDQLKEVQCLFSTEYAFVACLRLVLICFIYSC